MSVRSEELKAELPPLKIELNTMMAMKGAPRIQMGTKAEVIAVSASD